MNWNWKIFVRRVLIGAALAGLTALRETPDWNQVLAAVLAGALAGAGVDTEAFQTGKQQGAN